eukprot:CAMPEP_0206049090 /NCGR_PEP_ID=MMETSP1466-20131121/25946_1 /ASSEMBLY_ACC=CAM_ASM_001126 /TAXON_ID=44452 /ORGANISM="Pavlova gyrans, Strain CCMP608" /LENGTH=138 /DNA_ID=CAMNT_0053424173 /DNA_START=52 /DNA_END=466 /DNA_ORIENTATION=+
MTSLLGTAALVREDAARLRLALLQRLHALESEGEPRPENVEAEAAVQAQDVLQQLQAENGLIHLGHHLADAREEAGRVVVELLQVSEVLVEGGAVVDGLVSQVGGDARLVEVHRVAEAAHLAALHPARHAELRGRRRL